MGAGSQAFGPSSAAFSGHKQGAGWEVGLQGYQSVPLWGPRAYKARTLVTRLPCPALLCDINSEIVFIGVIYDIMKVD